jgi:hypothetical protein
VYRLRHYGDWRHLLGGVQPYEGSSSEFAVLPGGAGAAQAQGLVGRLRRAEVGPAGRVAWQQQRRAVMRAHEAGVAREQGASVKVQQLVYSRRAGQR